MPTYVYGTAEGEKGCPDCRIGLEVRHGMDEPGPEGCPSCGSRLCRRILAPGLALRHSDKSTLGDANLKRHGFKKLVNEGDGKFRVTL